MKILNILNESFQLNLTPEERSFIQQVISGEAELDDNYEMFEKLMDYYLDSGEMPYGVAKARDGDPVQWITDRLEQEFQEGL